MKSDGVVIIPTYNEKENIENIYEGQIAEKLEGNIRFKSVNFSYIEGKKILEDVTFSINKGEKVALVGETGAGKTTIINLILGFYKINSGNILFDGKNMDDISLESIRKNISFIQQNPYIFDDTIKRNIIINDNNTISDEKLIDILEAESPNIIAITGDLIDSNHTNLEVALSFAQQAVKIAPCYFVTGNHEAWIGSQYEELKTSLQNTGITVLQDEAIELNYGDVCIQLIGLNDPDFSERDRLLSESILEVKLSQVNISDGFTILLSHRPEYFNVYQNKNIDLVLSGHAHGGQFRLPLGGGVIAPGQGLFPKYDAGAYTENGTTMIVSRGIGNSIIPVRINNPPEIVIIELNCG